MDVSRVPGIEPIERIGDSRSGPTYSWRTGLDPEPAPAWLDLFQTCSVWVPRLPDIKESNLKVSGTDVSFVAAEAEVDNYADAIDRMIADTNKRHGDQERQAPQHAEPADELKRLKDKFKDR